MKSASVFLYGTHAALAAIKNPMRKIRRVVVTKNAQKELSKHLAQLKQLSVVENQRLESLLPPNSVHQGIVVECEGLQQPELHEWLAEGKAQTILMLDQITDPHNVGAILRSAAAFNVGAIITTDRHAPKESGVMAKSASGGLEVVPMISVNNLVSAIKEIKEAGYWIYGLDGHSKDVLTDMKIDAKTCLVLGSEGSGMRRLTSEHCDFLVKLPMSGNMESLNVSNAAAVALYDIFRKLPA